MRGYAGSNPAGEQIKKAPHPGRISGVVLGGMRQSYQDAGIWQMKRVPYLQDIKARSRVNVKGYGKNDT